MPSVPVLVVQALLTYGPDIARSVKSLLTKSDATDVEIEALIVKVEALDFDASRNAARKLVAGGQA